MSTLPNDSNHSAPESSDLQRTGAGDDGPSLAASAPPAATDAAPAIATPAPDAFLPTGQGATPALSPAGPSAPNRWLLPAVTGVVGLVVGAGAVGAVWVLTAVVENRSAVAVLTDAVDACALTNAAGIDLGDDGTSLTFDMQGDEDTSGASIDDLACIFTALDMPSAVSSHIDQTTSVDGRQTETWDDLTISWSYHPDRGLDGVLTVETD